MLCPNCGKENEPEANFCSRCGASLADKGAQATVEALIRQYLEEVASKPGDASAHNNLGLAYMYRGLDDLAIMEFEKVKSLVPDFPDVHYHLGTLYLKKGLKDRAMEEFQEALRLDPDQPKVRKILERLKVSQ